MFVKQEDRPIKYRDSYGRWVCMMSYLDKTIAAPIGWRRVNIYDNSLSFTCNDDRSNYMPKLIISYIPDDDCWAYRERVLDKYCTIPYDEVLKILNRKDLRNSYIFN